ncbi:MAG: hypothetical protein V1494_05620 [Candidatus Diapherotrites archaeon]
MPIIPLRFRGYIERIPWPGKVRQTQKSQKPPERPPKKQHEKMPDEKTRKTGTTIDLKG